MKLRLLTKQKYLGVAALFLLQLTGCASFDRLIGYEPSRCRSCGECRCCGETGYENRRVVEHDRQQWGDEEITSSSRAQSNDIHAIRTPKDSSDDVFRRERTGRPGSVPDAARAEDTVAADQADELIAKVTELQKQLEQERLDREVVDRRVDALNKSVASAQLENKDLKAQISTINRNSELQHENAMATLKNISQMVEQIDRQKYSSSSRQPPPFSH